MRPLLLRMQAFGPYAQEEIINFEDGLKGKRIFLIHGTTGAGKTSILDGICFALYGESSVNSRKSEPVRSDFAEENRETFVELIFTINNNRYKIWRKPQQSVKKQRGTGTRTSTAEAILLQLTDEAWTPIAENVNNVTTKINEIIGLSPEQFRQVIMLPQGEFRKMLEATSSARSEILANLFHTAIYEEFENFLTEKSKEYTAKYEDLRTKRQELLDKYNAADSETFTQKISGQENLVARYLQELDELGSKQRELSARLAVVENDNRLLADFEKVSSTYDNLNARKEYYAGEEKRLELGRALLELRSYEERLAELKKAITAFNKEKEDAIAKKTEMLQKKEALAKKIEAHEAKREEIEAMKSRRERIGEYIKMQGELASLENEKRKLIQLVGEAEKSIKSKETTINDCTVAIENLKKALASDDRDKIVKEISDAENILKELLQKKGPLGELEKLNKEKQYNTELLSRKLADQKVCETVLQTAEQQLHELIEREHFRQAGALAAELREGEPCPVCGSLSHPARAAYVSDSAGEKEIGECEEAIARHKETLAGINREIAETEKTLEVKKMREEDLRAGLGNYSSIELVNQEAAEMTNRTAMLRQELEKYRKDSEKLALLENNSVHYREKYNEAKDAFYRHDTQLQIVVSKIEQLKTGLPEEMREISDPGAAAEKLSAAINSYQQEENALRTGEKQTAGVLQGLEERLTINSQLIVNNETEYLNKNREFENGYRQDGITSYEEYCNNRIGKDELAQIELKIRNYREELRSAQDQFIKCREQCRDKTFVDPADLKNALANINNELIQKGEQKGSTLSMIAQLTTAQNELAALEKKIDALEKEYKIAGAIANVAAGKSGNAKIPFKMYMMITILDEVLELSNRRLKIMSKGRYIFTREAEKKRRGYAGLDIAIFDCETGKERSVSTLSGGEGFLASLSLAMGLADVVQIYSGGREMETIFIDEGFGSLDPETLDKAIKTLIEINTTGRLVGIISHVGELQNRFADCRLEVKKGTRGSYTEFHVL